MIGSPLDGAEPPEPQPDEDDYLEWWESTHDDWEDEQMDRGFHGEDD